MNWDYILLGIAFAISTAFVQAIRSAIEKRNFKKNRCTNCEFCDYINYDGTEVKCSTKKLDYKYFTSRIPEVCNMYEPRNGLEQTRR